MIRSREKSKRKTKAPNTPTSSVAAGRGSSRRLFAQKPGVSHAGQESGKAQSATPYEQRRLNQIAARWDARAGTWDRALRQPACHLNEDWAYSRFLVQADAVIARRQQFCLQGGVIDVGCGTGIVLAHVASRFAWGIGVDISRDMIRVARTKSIPNARFLKTDMFKLSRICPSAAAIVSRGVLLSHYGCQQGAALLRELRRALVPGGFVLLDFLNRSARHAHHHVSETKTYFRGEEICRMARQAGFKTIKILGRMERRVLLLIAEVNGCSGH